MDNHIHGFNIVRRILKSNEYQNRYSKRNLEKLERVIFQFAKLGWLIDNYEEIPNKKINWLVGLLYSDQQNEIDQYFFEYYNNHISCIKARILSNNPSRQKVILEAFKCLELGLHFASISLLLTLVDGICYQRLNKKFFINDRKNEFRPQVEKELSNRNFNNYSFLLGPIKNKTPINVHESNIDSFPIFLNRHQIIHGVDYEYGTLINNLKVLSYVSYIDKIIDEIKDK